MAGVFFMSVMIFSFELIGGLASLLFPSVLSAAALLRSGLPAFFGLTLFLACLHVHGYQRVLKN